MLSDEEKKNLLKKLQYCELEYQQDGYLSVGKFEAIKQAVEVIEKQSKEIEELKKPKYVINCKTNEITKLTNDFVSKDKIKAKIEEVDIQLQKLKDGLTGRKTNFVNKNMLFAQKKALQSLLEKE